MNFIAIDFETANSHRSSPCSLGICVVKNFEIVEEREWLIRPPRNHYNSRNIEIHGITPEITETEPEFNELWDEIKPYLHKQVIVAHNANNMDALVLRKTLEYYEISYPESNYTIVDTLRLSKSLLSWKKDYKLSSICDLFSIPFDPELLHNSMEDAKLTAKLALKFYEHFNLLENFEIDYYKEKKETKTKNNSEFYDPITQDTLIELEGKKISTEFKGIKTDLEDVSHYFFNKKVVITGEFEEFPIRDTMAELLHNVGAKNQTGVNRATDFVILGRNAGWKKIEIIEELKIKTITEAEFIQIFKI